MVTREEVAKKCGVSTMTVTRVAIGKGYIKEETRRKVQRVIEELGYFPNKTASNLAQRKSNEIAVILPDLNNPYYLQVIDAIIREATKYGYVATIFKANNEELPDVLKEVVSIRVAGVVNYSTAFPDKFMKVFEKTGVKIIRGNGYDVEIDINLDYGNAIDDAVKTLKNNGAEKVLFVVGMSEDYAKIDPRPMLFCESMRKNGLYCDASSLIYGNYPEEKAFIVGYQIATDLLSKDDKPDAVFCMNDIMAYGFISAAKSKGMTLPNELAVIGFDDIYLSAFYDPSLSTIAIDIENEAKLYVDYIVGVPMDKASYKNPCFIERNSTNFLKNRRK